MNKLPAENLHANDPIEFIPLNSITQSVLDQIESDYGVNSKAAFQSLNSALSDLLTIIEKMMNDVANKKNALTANLGLVHYSVIGIPDPSVPNLTTINQTIGAVLGGYVAPDFQSLQRAVSLANAIRVPSVITEFEEAKISLVSAKLNKQLADLMSSRNLINALKKSLESRL